jgi:hypothetical protein
LTWWGIIGGAITLFVAISTSPTLLARADEVIE